MRIIPMMLAVVVLATTTHSKPAAAQCWMLCPSDNTKPQTPHASRARHAKKHEAHGKYKVQYMKY